MTSQPSNTAASSNGSPHEYSGRVKWFNNKYGYGFITVVKGPETSSVSNGTDVFAHHSEIRVANDQYRYLVQGEYVTFDVIKTTSGDHEYQCANVKGMYGGQLICETRNETRLKYKASLGSGSDQDVQASHYDSGSGSGSGSGVKPESTRRFAGVSGQDRESRGRTRGGSRGGRGGGGIGSGFKE
jgi:cold shock CspA family protein